MNRTMHEVTQRMRTGAVALLLGCALVAVPTMQATAGDADNSERNVRDRNDATLTPLDQGGSESDRTITQKVRQAVVKHEGMSVNAQNAKIITVDGVVTLRGPVKTPEEKATIGQMAQNTAGVKRVDNQLEVERDH